MEWLIPICLFWPMAAGYLGGFPVDVVKGNPLAQVAGIFVSFGLFLGLWWLLRLVLGAAGGVFFDLVLPTGLAILALPVIVQIGGMLLGVRIQRSH